MEKCIKYFSWLTALLLLVCATANFQPLENGTGGALTRDATEKCEDGARCSPSKVCVDLKCVDLCQGVCGANTVCEVQDLQPLCSCKLGYFGDPLRECRLGEAGECTQNDQCPLWHACVKQRCVDPCQWSCGVNTDCRVVNHRPVCACLRGFVFRPHTGCSPQVVPECISDFHCAQNQACRQQQCVDPCEDGVCVNTTTCHVKNHYPVCVCKPGVSEDECQPTRPSDNKVEKKTFLFVKEALPWFDALDNCSSSGMTLASVDSEQEWNEVVEVVRLQGYKNGFWLGGHTRGIRMIWLTTGKNITFSNWKSGNNVNGDCLYSRSYFQWTRENCMENHAFVCNSV